MVKEFTNERGTRFAIHEPLTQWAQMADAHGTALPTVYCLQVTTTDGVTSLLLMDGDTVLMDATSVEAVAAKIDMIKVAKVMGG